MRNKLQEFHGRVRLVLGSNRFFYATVVLLVLESAWLALSGLFSMAYDEDTHFDVIKLYAHHISPFWSHQPDGPANFGAMTRDLSYMYQYLMSFVYRFISLFAHTDTPKVIAIRFCSIAFMAAGFFLYRKVLLKTTASKVLVHLVLAVLALTPTVPFLAAQINYDNLLFLCSGIMLMTTIKIIEGIKRNHGSLKLLFMFFAFGMFTCLVMYAFAPVFLVLTLWLAVVYWQAHDGRKSLHRLWPAFRSSFLNMGKLTRVGLVIMLLISGALFFERYGVNTIRYDTPLPECDQVLSVQRCMDYGPWRRNYLTYQDKINGKLPPVSLDPITYTMSTWLRLMSYQLFFTLNGKVDNFSVGAPLVLPLGLAILVAVITLPLVIWRRQDVLRRPFVKGLAISMACYVAALWLQNYSDYVHLHLAVAIQSRYLILILPLAYLFAAMAIDSALQSFPRIKSSCAVLLLFILLFQGGGIEVFILRSNPMWYWPNNTVTTANDKARSVLRQVVVGDGLSP